MERPQSNISAVDFYRSLGYIAVGDKEEMVGGVKIRIVVMERDLPSRVIGQPLAL